MQACIWPVNLLYRRQVELTAAFMPCVAVSMQTFSTSQFHISVFYHLFIYYVSRTKVHEK